jgi:prevent-host-death family protein
VVGALGTYSQWRHHRFTVPVLRPLAEHGRYDLVMEINRTTMRVQCKWAYLLPAAKVEGRRAIQLRVGPAKNGQRAALNWAAPYSLSGAIAQLGERRDGIAKVVGSSPTGSTHRADSETVGAHVFRNHFGWYMERANAGERFLVTRRGKPYVRLIPAEDAD